MSTSNPWLNPFQRSYNDIKGKLIESLQLRVPEMTDMSEGNIFVLILSIFAGIAEVIHYYIDGMAREAFLPTCRRYSSLYKHAKLVDYHIKSAVPATVDLTIYRDVDETFPVFLSDIIIPQNTQFNSVDGKVWITTREIKIEQGTTTGKIPLSQKELVNNQDFGTYSDDIAYITLDGIAAGKKYVEGSMVIFVAGEAWQLVDTFAYYGPKDKVYKVELNQSLQPYILFGDGKYGMKPNIGDTIVGQYYVTYGAEGNLPENKFATVPEIIRNIDQDLAITNMIPATGGSDYEDFNMLKAHIPLSVKTLGVAITKEDYESVAKLIPGVDKAYCNYICGKYVEIYITPDGGSEASTELIHQVEQQMEASKVLTTRVRVYSTHMAKIFLSAVITGKKSFKSIDISNQVKAALVDRYNYQNSDINQPVRLSDIYALIDNQSMVDFLTLTELYLLPYPIAINARGEEVLDVPALNVSYFRMLSYKTEHPEDDYEVWYIETYADHYRVREPNNVEWLPTDFEYNKPYELGSDNTQSRFIITISNPIENTNYDYAMYRFVTQPMGTNGNIIDLIPHNFNIPIIKAEDINLTINEVV